MMREYLKTMLSPLLKSTDEKAGSGQADTIRSVSKPQPPAPSYRSPFKDIFEAVQKRSLNDVRYFVETKGINVNVKDDSGWALLFSAVLNGYYNVLEYGYDEMVQYLIDQGANVNVTGQYDTTPLHEAAGRSHPGSVSNVEIVRCLINGGANVNATTHDNSSVSLRSGIYTSGMDGFTPLHSAAHSADFEVVKCLLDHGADINGGFNVNKKTPRLGTPLHLAIPTTSLEITDAHLNSCVKVVKYLIDHGADPNMKNKHDQTPLDIVNGYTKTEKARRILRGILREAMERK